MNVPSPQKAKSRGRRFGKSKAKGTTKPALDVETCLQCRKELDLCVCASTEPVATTTHVLILRHPQEQDRALGTAVLTSQQFQNSTIKTGLSWSSLTKIMDTPIDPKKWGVLFLGTAKAAAPLPKRLLSVVSKLGTPVGNQDEILESLEGIILLDGSWQQAKALWWRNAWLLKCPRLILQPPRPSYYGNLRKEPRRESVSTLEAAAYTVAELEHDAELVAKILAPFHILLEKAKAKNHAKSLPKPAIKAD